MYYFIIWEQVCALRWLCLYIYLYTDKRRTALSFRLRLCQIKNVERTTYISRNTRLFTESFQFHQLLGHAIIIMQISLFFFSHKQNKHSQKHSVALDKWVCSQQDTGTRQIKIKNKKNKLGTLFQNDFLFKFQWPPKSFYFMLNDTVYSNFEFLYEFFFSHLCPSNSFHFTQLFWPNLLWELTLTFQNVYNFNTGYLKRKKNYFLFIVIIEWSGRLDASTPIEFKINNIPEMLLLLNTNINKFKPYLVVYVFEFTSFLTTTKKNDYD